MQVIFDEHMSTALQFARDFLHSNGQSTSHLSDEALFDQVRDMSPSTILGLVELQSEIKRLKANSK